MPLSKVTLFWSNMANPAIDLFASRSNTKTPTYFSWEAEHHALGQDCFYHQWQDLGVLYAFPPPILIAKVLHKWIQDDAGDMILITPAWTSAPWWPSLLRWAARPPLVLPCTRSLVWNPIDQPSFHCRWSLLAWHLSITPVRHRECRGRQSRQPYIESTKMGILRSMTPRFTGFSAGSATPNIVFASILTRFQTR